MFQNGEGKFHETGKFDPSAIATGKIGGKGKAKSGSSRRASSSRSAQAGLNFPVGRIQRMLKQASGNGQRCSITAGVAMASVIEYLCAELLELSGNCARDNNLKRITPRNILTAVKSDEELARFITAWIPNSGTVPTADATLAVKKASKKDLNPDEQ